ncbi:MAG: hypothetical protein HYR91_01460 [Flavobacteriia bacterium]|nr:hypothetical protein [Flavobacteriia bacterium]
MKTNLISIAIFIGVFFNLNAQDASKPTIAVATPSIQGLGITPKICTKIIYLELIKINQFSVYDEFDISEVVNSSPTFQKDCFGLNCLTSLGNSLKVNYITSGSIDRLGAKIIVSLKIIDVKTGTIYKSTIKEFSDHEDELQRMIEITLRSMLGLENIKEIESQLSFNNEIITSKNVGKINNSGPRIGYAMVSGSLAEFAKRKEDQGGLGVYPGFSMIGYQFEKQYIGTDNFSALFESIFNVSGLEQGQFIPSVALMNGFRFGKKGWEFAFGPSFGIQKTSKGFFDSNNKYGKGENYFWSENDFRKYEQEIDPTITKIPNPIYSYNSYLDTRGTASLSTRWVMGIGRTFRSGALYIPINLFYSSTKKGGMLGLSIGFNVVKKKESIYNGKRY